MIEKVIKTNSVAVTYETLSNLGKKQNKKQDFNLVSYEATDEDFYLIGKSIGDMLVSRPKEVLKNTTTLLMEV